jgi:hypothetical protein
MRNLFALSLLLAAFSALADVPKGFLPIREFPIEAGVVLSGPAPVRIKPSKEPQPVYLDQHMVYRVVDLRQFDAARMVRYTIYAFPPNYANRTTSWKGSVDYITSGHYSAHSSTEWELAEAIKNAPEKEPVAGAIIEPFEVAAVPYSIYTHTHQAGVESICVRTMLPVGRQVVFINYCEGSKQPKPRSTEAVVASKEFQKFLSEFVLLADPGLWRYEDYRPRSNGVIVPKFKPNTSKSEKN